MAIKVLDEQLANKIAAGEVIERPASVVKELVENSIDAGASEIQVTIEEAGRKLIRVADNGSGMTREDAVLSLQRHATSKISTSEDLFAIRTLGFRGEALPSIASVSHFRMVTRRHDAAEGVELVAHGGVISDLRDTGCPAGTRIEVRQLFFNTPARLKFLKSDQTEIGHISEFINAVSLSRPDLNLRFSHNDRQILSRPSTAQMLSHIGAWLGNKTADAMLPISLELPGVCISGYIGKPEAARANRGGQLFFVNGRRIVNRTLTHALESSFQSLLDPGRYPVAVILLTIDPEQVDVNVHPAKAEVRFHRERELHGAVSRAVREALGGVAMVHELAVWQPARGAMSRATSAPLPMLRTPSQPLLNTTVPQGGLSPLASLPASISEEVLPHGLRAIGQFHGIFMLAEGRDALLLINQHRAHERVIFDQLMTQAGHVTAQRLIIPATAHLGPREAALLDSILPEMERFGFDIAPLSGSSYVVRAMPVALATQDPAQVLQELLADMEAGISIAPFECPDPARRAVEEGTRRLLAGIACKAALKAGTRMTPDEQQNLLDQLAALEQSAVCPHGDPVMMTITRYELDRKFHR